MLLNVYVETNFASNVVKKTICHQAAHKSKLGLPKKTMKPTVSSGSKQTPRNVQNVNKALKRIKVVKAWSALHANISSAGSVLEKIMVTIKLVQSITK